MINESTVLADTDVVPVVAALQKQVTDDFRPAWGTDAELKIVPKGTQPPAGSWWLVLLDDSDQANALGYHDLTTEGLPIRKVFAASDLKAGTSCTVTAGHELLEMLGDPNINPYRVRAEQQRRRNSLCLRSLRCLRRRQPRIPDR